MQAEGCRAASSGKVMAAAIPVAARPKASAAVAMVMSLATSGEIRVGVIRTAG